jgi:hypothetical protein
MLAEKLHFKLRIPEHLLEKVKERATISQRTTTGEILYMLENFEDLEKRIKETIHLNEIENRLANLELKLSSNCAK